MPTIAPRTSPRPGTDISQASVAGQFPDGIAAVDIPRAGTPCYIGSDGRVYPSNGASAATSLVHGCAAGATPAGTAVTLLGVGARFGHAAPGGFTPGVAVYVGGAAGEVSNTASTGGTVPFGYSCNDTDFIVTALRVA